MGRDIAITYKRRRLFSRTDEAHINPHPHSPSSRTEEEYMHEKERPTRETSSVLEEKNLSANLKEKTSSALITYSRRTKLNKNYSEPNTAGESDVTSTASKKPATTSSLVQLKNVDDKFNFTHKIAKNVQLNNVSVKEASGAQASRDIDLNLPLDYGYEENNHTVTSKVHLSADSYWKMKGMMPSFTKQNVVVGEKGKGLAHSSSWVLMSTSSKNYCFQLFTGSRSSGMTSQSNNWQNLGSYKVPNGGKSQLNQTAVQYLDPRDPYIKQGQINSYASNPSFYGWPNRSFYGRPNLDLQFSSNTVLTRARSTYWSEEELYSLWIGIRRHSNGNWAMMLRD